MTLAEFKKGYRWDSLDVVGTYSNYGLYSVLGLFFMILWHEDILLMLSLFILFVVPGALALFYMRLRLKLIRWDNGLSQKQNVELLRKVASKLKGDGFVPRYKNEVLQHENYLNLCYKWSTTKGYQIRLFADEGYILLNGHRDNSTLETFFYYGSACRFQMEILQFLKDSVNNKETFPDE